MVAETVARGVGGLFDGLLAPEVIDAYERLLASGGCPKDQAEDLFGAGLVDVLTHWGMVHVRPHSLADPAWLQPTSPDLALQGVLAGHQQRLARDQELLLDGQRRLPGAQARFGASMNGNGPRVLEVSRSGFYEWRDRPASVTALRRNELALYIVKSFDESDETYGYRRIHADLIGWGVEAGPELVRSIVRELGLVPCQPRPWRVSLTEGDGQEHDIPDLMQRDFTAAEPGQKMVGDITYIPTWEGWVYLATVIDCCTKAVVGWATATAARAAAAGGSCARRWRTGRWPAGSPGCPGLRSLPTACADQPQ